MCVFGHSERTDRCEVELHRLIEVVVVDVEVYVIMSIALMRPDVYLW